jgi:hypothetical protein
VSRRGHLAISEDVKRTSRGIAELLDHVRVDHRGLHVGVLEVFLNLPDVDSVEEQMRREAVTQRILTLLMNHRRPSFTTGTIPSTANP